MSQSSYSQDWDWEDMWDATEDGTNSHWESNDDGGFSQTDFDDSALDHYETTMDDEQYNGWLAGGGWEDQEKHSQDDMKDPHNQTGVHYVDNIRYNDDNETNTDIYAGLLDPYNYGNDNYTGGEDEDQYPPDDTNNNNNNDSTRPETKDPCIVAKELTTLGSSPFFQKAVQDIKNTPDFYAREYSIPLGKNKGGQIYAGTMNPGEKSSVELNHYIQGFFTDLHNHPSYNSHSASDLYNITVLNKLYPDYKGGVVLAGNEVYVAVVTDLAAAQIFAAKYINKPIADIPASYTDSIRDEISKTFNNMDSYLTEAHTKAKAIVLDKYNAGITFFKQGTNNVFYPLKMKEVKQADGSKKYTLIPCS